MREVPDQLTFTSVLGAPLFEVTFHPAADQVLRRRMLKYAMATAKLKKTPVAEAAQDPPTSDAHTPPISEQ